MQFENGTLIAEQLDSLPNTLPVEITFIDENNTVRYSNKSENIIFVRTKSTIRKVKNDHLIKSLDTVTKIVESFKSGNKNWPESWINMRNRMINICFFAIGDSNGEYLGTMEMVEDINDIYKIQGEKHLLD